MLGHACGHCQVIDAAHPVRLADPIRVRYDVLAAALSARSADRVAVVTCDSTVIELARQNGMLVVNEGHVRGLNVAVRLATAILIAGAATCVCTLLSDIPLVTSEDVDAAFAAVPEHERALVLVPSRDSSDDC
jgi:2-phospho-L-lactate guanylyltransferase (CobY/MobA/RfbA family)